MAVQLPQDRYIKVGHINTRFWAVGDQGLPVVLIHGLGGSVENWMLNVHALAERHQVYAVDLVGFGRSDRPSVPYSISYLTDFCQDFLTALEVERASLVGNATGGAVSLLLALRSPERVDKLVLVDSAGMGREVMALLRLASLPVVGELVLRPSRANAKLYFRSCFYDPARIPEGVIEWGYEMMTLPGTQSAFLRTLCSMCNLWGGKGEDLDTIQRNLQRITAPALIVWGKQDKVLPVTHAHIAAEKLPNAELHIFERCGHMSMFECAQAFNALVLHFLAR
jgi:pimeloyl-ACP methyl ester carboxylesterase